MATPVGFGPESCGLVATGPTPFNSGCIMTNVYANSGQTLGQINGHVALGFTGNSTSSWGCYVNFLDASNVFISNTTVIASTFTGSGGAQDFTANPPAGTYRAEIRAVVSWHHDDAGTFTVSGTYDPALSTAGTVCAYGTEQIPGTAGVIDWAGWVVNAVIKNPVYRWAASLLGITVLRPIILSELCSKPPPPDENLLPEDFQWNVFTPVKAEAQRKVQVKFLRMLWSEYCKCSDAPSGSPPPIGPGATNYVQPTFYVTYDNDTVNNYEFAPYFNITNLFRSGDTYVTNQTNALSTFPTRCAPDEWEEATVHEGLVGEGRWSVEGVVGFKVEVTSRDPGGLVLEGQPAYLWNMGWISILADELLLEEKRVTRSGYLWFPCPIKHATQFTFTLRTNVEVRVTELVTPAAIVLMG